MAKTQLNGNLKWVIAAVGLIITIASVYTTVVLAVGGVTSKADQNAKDIAHNQEYGCEPYNKIMAPKVVGFERDISTLTDDIAEIKKMQSEILAILMKQE